MSRTPTKSSIKKRPTSAVFVSFFFFSSRRRHTRLQGDWSSDVCSSDLLTSIRRQGRDQNHIGGGGSGVGDGGRGCGFGPGPGGGSKSNLDMHEMLTAFRIPCQGRFRGYDCRSDGFLKTKRV